MTDLKSSTGDQPEILVVDDSVDSLKLLTTALTIQGYRVRPAKSGELALASVAEKIPDLILLDVNMSGLNGYDVCQRLKKDDAIRHVPVIFISGLDEAIDKVRAFEVGGIDYITKPFQMEEVLARVKTQLNLQKMQMALAQSRDVLEERVSQRTQELQAANERLKKEIAERKLAEMGLRESEDRFRSTFEQAAVGIVHGDPSGRLLRANNRFCKIVGYSRIELLDLSWPDITHPDDLQDNLAGMKRLWDGKINIYSAHKRYVRKDKSVIWTNVTVSCVREPNGTPKYSIAVIEDITDRKLMEAQLLQAQKMEAIGTLAGGIAHDFNNILSSIFGFTELGLDDVAAGTELEDNLQEIYVAAKRARDLVKQILTFARQTKQEIGPVKVGDICREAINLLRATLPTNIEIKWQIQSKAVIMADASQIHQIVMNLCTNAYHAMEKNGGVLTIELNDVNLDTRFAKKNNDLKPGMYLRLTVADTGVGIVPKDMEAIFDPYFTTKEQGKGTGMGLSVVHGIVKQYGGAIIVESQPDRGSRFSVYLPEKPRRAEAAVPDDIDLPGGSESLLFVDDERAITKMQAQTLKRLGYGVEAYINALEALENFKARPDDFDMVITDMAMPHMNGDRLAAEILNIRPDIPIILCTGHSSMISEEKTVAMGIKAFIYKPIVKQDLARTIRQAFHDLKNRSMK